MEQLDRALVVHVPRSSRGERERSQWQDGCIAAIDVEEQPSDGTIDREGIGDGEASDSRRRVHHATIGLIAHHATIGLIAHHATIGLIANRVPAFGRLKEPDEIDGYEEG